jgi:hypothetical protein
MKMFKLYNITVNLSCQCYHKTLRALFILTCTNRFAVIFIFQDFRERKRTLEGLALAGWLTATQTASVLPLLIKCNVQPTLR